MFFCAVSVIFVNISSKAVFFLCCMSCSGAGKWIMLHLDIASPAVSLFPVFTLSVKLSSCWLQQLVAYLLRE